MLQSQIPPSKDIGQQKVRSKSHNNFKNLQTMYKANFEYGIVSTITDSESVINKIQKNTKIQNSFIEVALRLPKHVFPCLIHEVSGFPYVRERLITVGQNQLGCMQTLSLSRQYTQLGPT